MKTLEIDIKTAREAANFLKSSDWTYEACEKVNEKHMQECIRRIESGLKRLSVAALIDLIEEAPSDCIQCHADSLNLRIDQLTPKQLAEALADFIGWRMLGDFWCYESASFSIIVTP